MKILYIAFACNPYAGSEAQCGWSWVVTMRKHVDVSVITRLENREPIERYMRENNINNIKIYYHDIPSWFNIYNKTGKYYHVYYLMWQKTLGKMIKKLYRQNKYAYIHHVTLGDFRVTCNLKNIPAKFIFGPIGGAQLTPAVFSEYIQEDLRHEKKRELINKFVIWLPTYRKALNRAEWIFAANKETQAYIQRYLKNPNKCHVLTENGVLKEKLKEMPIKEKREIVSLIWAGRMVNRKGLVFLLDVIANVSAKKSFELILVGDGPEKNKLENRIKELHLGERVRMIGKVTYEEMQYLYNKSDIFVFPSLRETTGTVLFEAMANGIPVITFNQNGADMLIDETCGIKVNIFQSLEDIKKDFAAAISSLVDCSEKRCILGQRAYQKIVQQYTWEEKCEKFLKEYIK